jgi:hypothetical protein
MSIPFSAMTLELFGMDPTTSIIILIGIIWGAGIITAIVFIIIISCLRGRREQEATEPDRPSEPSDKLIPRCFATSVLEQNVRLHNCVTC